MRVLILTFAPDSDTRTDEPIQHKLMAWPGSSSDRKWLQNHLHHCIMNEKPVILEARPESN